MVMGGTQLPMALSAAPRQVGDAEGQWPTMLTARPTAFAPVFLDHGAQAAEGELLRLQHTALLHAARRWLRRLLRQRLRLAGPVQHGPDAGGVPAHREAQGGTASMPRDVHTCAAPALKCLVPALGHGDAALSLSSPRLPLSLHSKPLVTS